MCWRSEEDPLIVFLFLFLFTPQSTAAGTFLEGEAEKSTL